MIRFSSAVQLIALAGAVGMTAGKAQAQVTKPMSYSVSAGLSVPTGDFGDFYDSGYHIAGAVNFQQHASPIGFRVEAMFNQFKLSGSDPSENSNILSVTGNVVISAPNLAGPYLIAGVGIYGRSEPTSFGDSQNFTNLGVNAGAGYRFPLAGLDAFGEVRWHQDGSSNPNATFVPISFGVIF